MKLHLAFSSCPNDTFIFHALVNGCIDTQGFEFDVTLSDVETLNQAASESTYDVTKLSFAAPVPGAPDGSCSWQGVRSCCGGAAGVPFPVIFKAAGRGARHENHCRLPFPAVCGRPG